MFKSIQVAASAGKQIYLPSWVNKVWEASQTKYVVDFTKSSINYGCLIYKNIFPILELCSCTCFEYWACGCRHIHGSSSQFLEYSCPIFKGLVITVSGLDSEERNQVKKAVEDEGENSWGREESIEGA